MQRYRVKFPFSIKNIYQMLTVGNWTYQLLLILLGVKTTTKEDLDCFNAELVFGMNIRHSGELFKMENGTETVTKRIS